MSEYDALVNALSSLPEAHAAGGEVVRPGLAEASQRLFRALSAAAQLTGALYVEPSSDATVALNQAYVTAYAAYLATGRRQAIQLSAGNYGISSALLVKSYVVVRGVGLGETCLTWTGAAGSATDPLNAMFKAQGALTTKMVTTPTNVASGGVNYYPPGSHAVSVTAAGTLAVGDWWVFAGCNDPAFVEYGSSQGPSTVWQDLLRVQSIAGSTLTNYEGTCSYHTLTKGASTGSVQIYCRSVDVVENFGFEDLTIDASNIANGILVDYGVDFEVRRVGFKNVARFCLEARYSRGGLFEDNWMGGAVSGIVGGDASHDLDVRGTRCTGTGLRENTLGRIWGSWAPTNDCAGWCIENNHIRHFSVGFMGFGHRHLSHRNNTYEDLDATEFKIRNSAAGDGYSLGVVGVAVHGGMVDLNYAVFNGGFQDIGTTCIDCVSPSVDDCTYWWHDTFMCNIVGLSLMNRGKSPYQNIDGLVRYMQGIRTQDQEGQLVGYHSEGCEYSFRHNSSLGISLYNLTIRSSVSAGVNPVIGFYLDNPVTHEMRFVINCEVFSIYYGPSFGGANSQTIWKNLVLNDQWWSSDMRIARNRTGSVRPGGDIVSFDKSITTGERALVATSHAQALGLAVVVNGPGGFGAPDNGWTLVMPAKGHGLVSAGAAVARMGEEMKVDGAGAFTCSPGGAGASVGQNMTYKGAGAGLVQVSPSP